MIIGVLKEIKDNEYRVGLVPSGARALKEAGHRVIVEKGAGTGSSITDEEYVKAGAEISGDASEVYSASELIVKVKEPQASEYAYLKKDQIIFTFLHLAADRELTEELIKRGATAIGYETVEEKDGSVPILAPMSEVAGRLSVQVGANCLMRPSGGRGVLLGGVPGVEKGRVTIIGAGTVGINAALMAIGLGSRVTVLDTRPAALRHMEELFGSKVDTLFSRSHEIEGLLAQTDLLIGAVHIPGTRTPHIITRKMLQLMRKGSVIVDVSVDQGGCVETIRPTTHSDPTYEIDGVIHYGVANMPGAVPITSTSALTNVTLPYVRKLADAGLKGALTADPALARGVNIHAGLVVHAGLASSLGCEYTPLEKLL